VLEEVLFMGGGLTTPRNIPIGAVGSCGGQAACTLPSGTQAFEGTNSCCIAIIVLERLARSSVCPLLLEVERTTCVVTYVSLPRGSQERKS
jgi:hypothetical protein